MMPNHPDEDRAHGRKAPCDAVFVLDYDHVQLYLPDGDLLHDIPMADAGHQLALKRRTAFGASSARAQTLFSGLFDKPAGEGESSAGWRLLVAHYFMDRDKVPLDVEAIFSHPRIASITWVGARKAVAIGSGALADVRQDEGVALVTVSSRCAHAFIFSYGDFVWSNSVEYSADDESCTVAVIGLLKLLMDRVPPSLLPSLRSNGCVLGGRAIPQGLEQTIQSLLDFPVRIAEQPERAIVHGALLLAGGKA